MNKIEQAYYNLETIDNSTLDGQKESDGILNLLSPEEKTDVMAMIYEEALWHHDEFLDEANECAGPNFSGEMHHFEISPQLEPEEMKELILSRIENVSDDVLILFHRTDTEPGSDYEWNFAFTAKNIKDALSQKDNYEILESVKTVFDPHHDIRLNPRFDNPWYVATLCKKPETPEEYSDAFKSFHPEITWKYLTEEIPSQEINIPERVQRKLFDSNLECLGGSAIKKLPNSEILLLISSSDHYDSQGYERSQENILKYTKEEFEQIISGIIEEIKKENEEEIDNLKKLII